MTIGQYLESFKLKRLWFNNFLPNRAAIHKQIYRKYTTHVPFLESKIKMKNSNIKKKKQDKRESTVKAFLILSWLR